MTRALLALVLLGGCYETTQLVAPSGLAPLRHGDRRRQILLVDEHGGPTHLDPQTVVQVQRGDDVPLVTHGYDLGVSEAGLSREVTLALEQLCAARVEDLADADRRLLAASALVAGRSLVSCGDGCLELRAADLASWMDDFMLAVARAHDGPYHLWPNTRRCGATGPPHRQLRTPLECEREENDSEHAVRHLAWELAGRPLGRWRFQTSADAWSVPLEGEQLLDALALGLPGTDLARWSDVRGVAVTNVSGGKSFGAIVVTLLLSVAVMPLALLGKVPGPFGEVSNASASVVARSGPEGGGHVDATGAASIVRPAHGLPESVAARRLFDFTARRRGWVMVVPTLETGTDITRLDGLAEGGALVLRFLNVGEVGGGALHVVTTAPGGELVHSAVGFFRTRLHFDVDAARRWALVLGLDAGAGGDVSSFVRFAVGLRARVAGDLFLGLSLFDPTYSSDQGRPATRGGWTFPTTLELGTAL